MALTTPFPEIPESRTVDGIGCQTATYLILPGSSDYVTGGYALSALNLRLTRIHSVFVSGVNAAGAVYLAQIVFPATYFSSSQPSPATSVNFRVLSSAGFTPAGTISAPTITTTTNAGTTTPVYTNGGALTQIAGATGITGVQAPTFTGTAVAAAGFVELASGTDLSTCTWSIRVTGY